ncbi:hypothetical protein D6C78_10596 [Aureobasidium pullulans]|uniref:F-box domain-containing protein n=1 Tax=Aureobasidium pullulans TaxID=5580 RepID=A0A4T0B4L3_AURPU|nr:hypothetical protein D6C78_10596 [Aureobasidium pullulans]
MLLSVLPSSYNNKSTSPSAIDCTSTAYSLRPCLITYINPPSISHDLSRSQLLNPYLRQSIKQPTMNAHGRVGLNDLPLELQQRICRNLPGRDLKQLRLVSRHYASAAARDLPIIIHLFDEPQSCRDALEIARHPDLQIAVTAVAVDVSRIKDHKLREIIITNVYGAAFALPYTRQKCYTKFSPFLEPYSSKSPRSRFSLQQILNCLGPSESLTSLTVMPACFNNTPDVPTNVSSENLAFLESLKYFQCLSQEDKAFAVLLPILASAKHLAWLAVREFVRYTPSLSFPSRTELFDIIRSDSLEYINVDGCQATPDSLRDFLLHHAPNLKIIGTKKMRLVIPAVSIDVAWRDLASDLAGRFPKLDYLALEHPDAVGLRFSGWTRRQVCDRFRHTVMGRLAQERPILELEEALRDKYRIEA